MIKKFLNNKNVYLYISILIIFIFTIGYFLVISSYSHAFSDDVTISLYESKIKHITKIAELYGDKNKDLFKDKNSFYITVDDLITSGYLTADENGNIYNPDDKNKLLNDYKIRITLEKDKVIAKVLN